MQSSSGERDTLSFANFVDLITQASESEDQESLLKSFPAIIEHYGHGVEVDRSGGGL